MKSKIKIIHILCELNPGGAERFVLDLIKAGDQEKYDFMVCALMGGGALEEEFKQLGIKVKIFSKKTKLGLGLIWRLRNYFQKERPDIVHTHLFAGDVWGKIAAKLAGAPIIISTEHNINLDEGKIKQWLKRYTYSFTDKVIAVSSAVKKYVVETYKVSPDKIEVIYNGVEVEKFLWPEPLFFQHQPPILAVTARLEPQKGHRYLFQALASIKNLNWELWLVGDGSMADELKKLAASLNLKDKIKFLGVKQDVDNLLKQIDLFVLPSVWEGLGIVLLEAALAARPIIASDTGGIKDIIENGRTGWLVKPKDVVGLSQAIQDVLNNKAEAQKRALQLQKEVLAKFDIKKIVQQYESLYLL